MRDAFFNAGANEPYIGPRYCAFAPPNHDDYAYDISLQSDVPELGAKIVEDFRNHKDYVEKDSQNNFPNFRFKKIPNARINLYGGEEQSLLHLRGVNAIIFIYNSAESLNILKTKFDEIQKERKTYIDTNIRFGSKPDEPRFVQYYHLIFGKNELLEDFSLIQKGKEWAASLGMTFSSNANPIEAFFQGLKIMNEKLEVYIPLPPIKLEKESQGCVLC